MEKQGPQVEGRLAAPAGGPGPWGFDRPPLAVQRHQVCSQGGTTEKRIMPSCLKATKREKISDFQTQHFTLGLWISFFSLLLKQHLILK